MSTSSAFINLCQQESIGRDDMYIIQTIDGLIVEDFCLHLYLHSSSGKRLVPIGELGSVYRVAGSEFNTPIGSVEYVHRAMELCHRRPPYPMNIPEPLRTQEFLKRKVGYCWAEEVSRETGSADMFLKRVDVVKGYVGMTSYHDHLEPGEYMYSEHVQVLGEWRAFVSGGKIADVVRYGCPYTAPQPDFDLMKKMVAAYKDAPPAWTLDVGVGDRGTFLIECHHMYSVGLYGCRDILLPFMFGEWWRWFLNR
jgi:hypothetical protein